jgi:hypothetical protein
MPSQLLSDWREGFYTSDTKSLGEESVERHDAVQEGVETGLEAVWVSRKAGSKLKKEPQETERNWRMMVCVLPPEESGEQNAEV